MRPGLSLFSLVLPGFITWQMKTVNNIPVTSVFAKCWACCIRIIRELVRNTSPDPGVGNHHFQEGPENLCILNIKVIGISRVVGTLFNDMTSEGMQARTALPWTGRLSASAWFLPRDSSGQVIMEDGRAWTARIWATTWRDQGPVIQIFCTYYYSFLRRQKRLIDPSWFLAFLAMWELKGWLNLFHFHFICAYFCSIMYFFNHKWIFISSNNLNKFMLTSFQKIL